MPELPSNCEELLRELLADNPHLDVEKLGRVRELLERARRLGLNFEPGYSLSSPFALPDDQSLRAPNRRTAVRSYGDAPPST